MPTVTVHLPEATTVASTIPSPTHGTSFPFNPAFPRPASGPYSVSVLSEQEHRVDAALWSVFRSLTVSELHSIPAVRLQLLVQARVTSAVFKNFLDQFVPLHEVPSKRKRRSKRLQNERHEPANDNNPWFIYLASRGFHVFFYTDVDFMDSVGLPLFDGEARVALHPRETCAPHDVFAARALARYFCALRSDVDGLCIAVRTAIGTRADPRQLERNDIDAILVAAFPLLRHIANRYVRQLCSSVVLNIRSGDRRFHLHQYSSLSTSCNELSSAPSVCSDSEGYL